MHFMTLYSRNISFIAMYHQEIMTAFQRIHEEQRMIRHFIRCLLNNPLK